ncbi:MAG TPA: hypothetical protein PKW90_18035, partial [Myxococcota bacterium]|nr:hypothetical protein [Myxococcota bacterium]
PGGELYGHAWVLGWVAEAWPALPLGTDLALGASERAVIDPLPTWIFAGLSLGLGTVNAWNLRVLLSLWLTGVALGRLGALFSGEDRAFGVGAAMGLAMPSLLGSVISGLTEDFSWGLALWGLGDLWEKRPVRGGLWLGLSAGCGLYLAWMAAPVALGIGLWRLRAAPARWVAGGLLALGLAGLFAWPFRDRLTTDQPDFGQHIAREEPLWRLNPWKGSDLASYGTPGKQRAEVGGEEAMIRQHPSYLGYGALALTFAGGLHPVGLGLLGCVGAGAGEDLSWMGKPLGIKNPFWTLLKMLPMGDRWHHGGRLLILGHSLLALLAARGMVRLGRPALFRWAPPLLLAEYLLFSPAVVPLPGTAVQSPEIYSRLNSLPAGPVVVLGAAGPGIHPQKLFFDQRAHGRRLLHDPDRPGPPPRKLPAGTVVVALGAAESRFRQESVEKWGPPTVESSDGAAWWRP